MKVIEIRKSEYKDTKGNPRVSYWTKFEGESYQLYTPTKPLFTEGSDIPKESLELKQRTGKDPYYVIPDKLKDELGKPANKTTPASNYPDGWDREIWTTIRNSTIQASELVKVFVDPKMGLAEALKCTQDTAIKLFATQSRMWLDREKK